MTDHPIFFKLDVNFPEHPQTVKLSDGAFRALVELWCYCKRHQTDGELPLKIWKTVRKQHRDSLLKHFVIDRGTHVEMVGYLEHQVSAEEVAELRKRRVEAGRKGGQARARAWANAKKPSQQKPQHSLGHLDGDGDGDIDLMGKPIREGAATRRAVALPSNFTLTDSMKLWAQEKAPGVDIERETENFRDWHVSKGNTFKDWEAAWRTWMRRAIQNRPAVAAADQKKDWWFDS